MRSLALLFTLLPVAASADPCPHAFMPFKKGATWVYRLGSGGERLTMTLRVESVRKLADGLLAEVASKVLDKEERVVADVHQQYRCASDGLHTEPPLGNAMGAGGIKIDINVTERRGVTLPPPDGLTPGSAWVEGYTVAMVVPGQSPTRIQRDARLRVVSFEPLTVEAGAFDALHVAGEEAVTMPFRPKPVTRHTDVWYGKGVGMIRTRSDDATLELIKFIPGN
jgi:hypothetical protein